MAAQNPAPKPLAGWWAWGPSAVWAGVIWAASSLVIMPGMYPSLRGGDALFHGGEFFVYGFLLQRGAEHRRWPSGWRSGVRLMAVIVVTALVDEWRQAFVPSRHPGLMDAIVDGAAGALGLLGALRGRRAR